MRTWERGNIEEIKTEVFFFFFFLFVVRIDGSHDHQIQEKWQVPNKIDTDKEKPRRSETAENQRN